MHHVVVLPCFLASGVVGDAAVYCAECMRLRCRVEAAVTAALLHDVVDDTPIALGDVGESCACYTDIIRAPALQGGGGSDGGAAARCGG